MTRSPGLDRLRSRVSESALDVGLRELVRRGLRGVWVRGSLPTSAVVWAANHHSWWDGFVAKAVLAEQGRAPALVMDADNLDDYAFLRSLGVVSTRRPRQALQSVRDGRVLIVFPEGELRAPGALGDLHRGAAWFARQAPAALVPVAVRVTVRAHQYAEAYVDIGSPVPGEALRDALATSLAGLDDAIGRTDPLLPLPGFRTVVTGHESWDERISRLAGRWRR